MTWRILQLMIGKGGGGAMGQRSFGVMKMLRVEKMLGLP